MQLYDALSSVVDSGNTMAIQIAFAKVYKLNTMKLTVMKVECYKAKHLDSVVEMIWVLRSQAELVAAMGDPRYDTDPAYSWLML